MAITPQTNVRLLKCPLNINNKHQINFANVTAQTNYFLSLPYIELEECSYIRKDNVIRFPAHIDSIIEYNYVMYQNENYSDKWFYAYIIDMTYKADNLTLVTIGTDVWQTWQFDITFKESFVEREHILKSNDTFIDNLEPEGLEFGEPLISQVPLYHWYFEPSFLIAYGREPQADGLSSAHGTLANLNGMPNGVYLYAGSRSNLRSMINQINNAGFGDSIITVFTIPKCALLGYIDSNGDEWTEEVLDEEQYGDWITTSGDFTADTTEISLTSGRGTFEGYSPKNNKLFHYPYSYIGINPPNRKQ